MGYFSYICSTKKDKTMTFNSGFMIDLTMFNSESEIYDYLTNTGICRKLSASNLWDIKNGDLTNGDSVTKIWVDYDTYCVFAYSTERNQKFTVEFVEYLQNMKSLRPNEILVKPDFIAEDDEKSEFDEDNVTIEEGETIQSLFAELGTILSGRMTIDSILDKINSKGMNSLTNEELKFLKENQVK
jgi:hypothetical protein